MTYVKLEDVIKMIEDRFAVVPELTLEAAVAVAIALPDALRSLPTDDGWEDIATYEGPENEYLQVWCQCEDSGVRWTTAAYRTAYGQWFNDLEGYIPAKGYRPLPAPPAC